MTRRPLKIGLFGVGLDVYWDQFAGLKQRLEGYIALIATGLARDGVVVVNLGLVDSPLRASEAGHAMRESDVDLIFLHTSTYALSSTILPVLRRARVPVVILNLTPGASIDYARFNAMADRTAMTGEWLAWCGPCPVPEIANLFKRCGVPFFQVTGMIENDPVAAREVGEWIDAAKVAHTLEHNRLGALGSYYNGMLDIYTDLTRIIAAFGSHIEILEVEELAALRRTVTEQDATARIALFRAEMDVGADCAKRELLRAARTSLALDALVEQHQLGALAYYHKGAGSDEHEDVMTSIIAGASLLTARGTPVAGEYEIKNAFAMKILDGLGAGGSFTEYYAIDYADDVVLMGHDGPGHIAIAEGKTRLRPLPVYHGKVGQGLSVEMSVRHGPVTLLSVIEGANGTFQLLTAEGESVPGPILEIGNTNSRYRFATGARGFVESWNSHGPAHHCAIGLGHVASRVSKLAALLGLEHLDGLVPARTSR